MTTRNFENNKSFVSSLNAIFNPQPKPSVRTVRGFQVLVIDIDASKKEVVYKPEFFKTFVKIGWESYDIQVATKGRTISFLGHSFDIVDSKKEFIIRNGEVLFIDKDALGNKILVKE